MKNLAAFIFVLLILTPFVARSFMFIVDETEQAVVIQFGKPLKLIVGDYSDQDLERLNDFVKDYNKTVDQPVEISQGAGLYFKVPFVQNVRYFEDRLLEYDAAPTAVVTQDKKNLVIDNFASQSTAHQTVRRLHGRSIVREGFLLLCDCCSEE